MSSRPLGVVGDTIDDTIEMPLPMKESENMRTDQIKQMVMSRYGQFAETGGRQEEC